MNSININEIINSLTIGACNTDTLATMCEQFDGGSDVVIEAREEAAEMRRQIKSLRSVLKGELNNVVA